MFAAFVQGPLIRIIPVGIILLALQRTIFVELTVDGVILQVMTDAAVFQRVVDRYHLGCQGVG